MTAFLTIEEVIRIHDVNLEASGGSPGIRDLGALEASLAAPQMTFGGADLHENLAEKAAALVFALIANHPFVDGNKRAGYAAMEIFLVTNGYESVGTADEKEAVIVEVASGRMDRAGFTAWVVERVHPVTGL